MTSGNRNAFIAVLVIGALGAFAATGRVGASVECPSVVGPSVVGDNPPDLQFERIALDADPGTEAAMLAAAANRMVSFEWNAGTGELSFTAHAGSAAITLPGALATVTSVQMPSSCGSH